MNKLILAHYGKIKLGEASPWDHLRGKEKQGSYNRNAPPLLIEVVSEYSTYSKQPSTKLQNNRKNLKERGAHHELERTTAMDKNAMDRA